MPSPVTIAFVSVQLTIVGLWYAGRFSDASVFEVFSPTLLWIGLGIRAALVHVANSLSSLIALIFSTIQELANNKRSGNDDNSR